jgi:hypothetical protein
MMAGDEPRFASADYFGVNFRCRRSTIAPFCDLLFHIDGVSPGSELDTGTRNSPTIELATRLSPAALCSVLHLAERTVACELAGPLARPFNLAVQLWLIIGDFGELGATSRPVPVYSLFQADLKIILKTTLSG